MENLLMGLADRQFFLSLELTKFAFKLAVSLKRDQLVSVIFYQRKVMGFLLYWGRIRTDIGLTCNTLQLKYSLLLLSGHWPASATLKTS